MLRQKFLGFICIFLFVGCQVFGETLNIHTGCIFIKKEASSPVRKAAEIAQKVIEERTGLEFSCQSELSDQDAAVIVLGTVRDMPELFAKIPTNISIPEQPEAFAIWVHMRHNQHPALIICGRDERGVLFGTGKFLRSIKMTPGTVSLPADLTFISAPRYPIRGHELGYRHKSNTYDAWSLEQFENYIRDLSIFGINTVQLVCELEHMGKEGPYMTETVWERTPQLTDLLNSYGLNVWIWLPPGRQAFNAATAEETLNSCRELFRKCSRIDAAFVPGGDPGDAHPQVLLPWVERLAGVLRESHPSAGVWLSNEDMPAEWNNYLFEFLQREQPSWLTGLVFGTWVKMSLKEMRKSVPQKYPIVQYADITHCIECQYPVHDWDRAFAFTLGREPINPRPRAMECIYDFTAPETVGFIGYSDGVNDDVNKVVWALKGWDPSISIDDTLKDYARVFAGDNLHNEVAAGLKELERNWEGPLVANQQIEKTLDRWRRIEQQVNSNGANRSSWRLQMGIFRAYYDAYIHHRLLWETQQEQQALEELKKVDGLGVDTVINNATQILAKTDSSSEKAEFRDRLESLGKSLFQNIGIQMSVEKYGAANWERGAVLDMMDTPLTDRPWLEAQFKEILSIREEPKRKEALQRVLNWETPNPGAYYDDLGNPSKQPHLVRQVAWESDPGFVHSPQNEFIEIVGRENWRRSWLDQAQTLYGTPLKIHYEGLEPGKSYTLRVVYTGRFRPTMKLLANGIYEIHGALSQPANPEPLEFPIPQVCTAGGILDLEWVLVEGRGCQVAEIWLIPSVPRQPWEGR